MRIAQILLPLPLPEAFDYEVPKSIELGIGDFVKVPLGKTEKIGVVWGLGEIAKSANNSNLKEIIAKIEIPPLASDVLKFTDWCAKYLVVQSGIILSQILRPIDAIAPEPQSAKIHLGINKFDTKTKARKAAFDYLSDENYIAQTKGEIAKALGISVSVINTLLQIGAIEEQLSKEAPRTYDLIANAKPAELNASQLAAKEIICAAYAKKEYAPFLLDGITGSGKTEVYLEAIGEILEKDKTAQILILLPEIALTQTIIARISERFATTPIEWHTGVSNAKKRRAWRDIANNSARIVIGARSAIFLPFTNLSMIIVDEEHDASYKQDDGLRYNARDLAVVRAKFANSMIVLASATPSLESRNNALSGRYRHLVLSERFGAAVLPNIELIDMKSVPPPKGQWISPLLIEAMADSLMNKEQVLLFLNRRGFAPVVLCSKCGHRMMSPNSSSWLVEHKYSNRLVCHLTGYSIPKPINCPNCHSYDSLVSIGPGVERIAHEAKEIFPKARIEIFSSDSASSPKLVQEMVTRMENGEIDIMVGTQIAAKGHNFPRLTLVGVIDGDLGLKGGDPRAGERTYQLLTQVAGRAGRAGLKGKAIIQTYYPESEAFQALLNGDRETFLQLETDMRAAAGMPPFGRLAALQLMAKSDELATNAAQIASDALFGAHGIEVWGPAPPPLAIIRGWHRKRFLVRAERNIDLSGFMAKWRSKIKLPPSVRLSIDIEPYSFM